MRKNQPQNVAILLTIGLALGCGAQPAGSDEDGDTGPLTFNAGSSGLKGEYFDTATFDTLKLTRLDTTVNFDWGQGSPSRRIAADTFSVRWTGRIQAAHR
jgi:hypothetical protein